MTVQQFVKKTWVAVDCLVNVLWRRQPPLELALQLAPLRQLVLVFVPELYALADPEPQPLVTVVAIVLVIAVGFGRIVILFIIVPEAVLNTDEESQ